MPKSHNDLLFLCLEMAGRRERSFTLKDDSDGTLSWIFGNKIDACNVLESHGWNFTEHEYEPCIYYMIRVEKAGFLPVQIYTVFEELPDKRHVKISWSGFETKAQEHIGYDARRMEGAGEECQRCSKMIVRAK
jgi:hypothetical protein